MDQVKDFIIDFMAVFYEAMPFIVLGSIIAGILEELLPQHLITRVFPKNRYLAIGLSALLGLIFPMCECGIVPVMRRLLGKGLPLSCCIAYMLAGPIINGVVIYSTYVAFSPHVGGHLIIYFRVGLGYLVAVGTALVVDRLARKYGNQLLTPLAQPKPPALPTVSLTVVGQGAEAEPPVKKSVLKRLGNITETALHDFVDITVFLSLGAMMSAITRLYLDPKQIADLSNQYPALAIISMMALAVVMCLCSEADAFVAASFTLLHPSAKLAFLVLGPMLDLKLLMMFTRVFRVRLIWTIVVCLLVQVFIYTLALHYLWGQFGWPRNLPTG